jgi:hypothetical protein
MTHSDFDFDVISGPALPPLAALLQRPPAQPAAPKPAPAATLDQDKAATESPATQGVSR